ncbi:hypothetical protein EVJ58_g2464 [Rhodofomes roseus]|uniref:Clathrin/coatomer adaptor adaptin-like N-terminal domain-containing protein n=1 Tax=Rhodofomes roseus TaxID=34475 RepID=A0A4Y9YSE6_9APHY|nr:hypothetical protein EVJ58_g2464 [Rhodofomes roseus]
MDVPFVSSGAISRSQYALVRKVETAQTPQLADQYILAEVDSIRSQLSRSTLTLVRAPFSYPPDIALMQPVEAMQGIFDSTAILCYEPESGPTVQDKRIGYLFCAEAMPPDHELQLMLVNTLRKDLESPELPRICLALDTLIRFSTADVIPAIQSRLTDLFSFTSRALFAFHKLSKHDTGILSDVAEQVEKRMTDADWVVGSAALTVWADLLKAGHLSSDRYHQALSALLTSAWRGRPDPTKNVLLPKMLGCLQSVTPTVDDVRTIIKVVKACVAHGPTARVHLAQRPSMRATSPCLTQTPPSSSPHATRSSMRSAPLIASSAPAPNDVYVFVSCLSTLDPALWAGTRADVPAVLEEWEVERVVALLEAEDHSIRVKTMRLLRRVDPAILEAYCTRLLSSVASPPSAEVSATARRLLELADVLSDADGEAYAGHAIRVCDALESQTGMPAPLEKRPVVQEVVEGVLVKMHDASSEFKSGCVGALFAQVPEKEVEIGPTLMVILTALIVEYLPLSPLSPTALLRGLGSRVGSYTVSIQDACLLCMIRLAAECEKVPSEIVDAVGKLRETSRAYIRRRCDQFLELSSRLTTLKEIIVNVRAPSLPDFVAALETYKPQQAPPSPSHSPRSPPLRPIHSPDRPSSRASSQGGSRLRYDAYEPPRPVQRHFARRLSAGSDASSRFVGQRGRAAEVQDPLARTMSPGELALAAGDELETLSSVGSPRSLPVVNVIDEDDSATRADLIALDSPFMSEPVASISDVLGNMRGLGNVSEDDFKQEWDSMSDSNARGWCEVPAETVVERLRNANGHWDVTFITAEEEPFTGDTKILVQADLAAHALLRIKASEDNTSLWHMRCLDTQLRTAIKAILSDM